MRCARGLAINSEATLAGPLLKTFLDAGEGHDFIAPDQTLDVITPNTLLIVVDTYQKRLLESQQIYEKCKRVVVIDHHRMAVGHIDNPTLIYHEPYASSASELVCELLQFMPKENNITPLEAQALLAGIMLDTRSFALHVGVRTFEAAAWLRSRGAQTADTKLLFNTSKEEYEARAHIVEAAYIYKGCAIALSDELEAGMNVVLPMAANDLLTINGLCAADTVLIPLQCEYYALEGLSDLLSTIRIVKRSLNPDIDLEGVVLTMFDGRTNLSMQVAEEVKRHFPGQVYATVIPRNVRLSEAPSFGKPVSAYDALSRGAEAYDALAQELLEHNQYAVTRVERKD